MEDYFLIYGYDKSKQVTPSACFPGREIACITMDYHRDATTVNLEITYLSYDRSENVSIFLLRNINECKSCLWWSDILELTRHMQEVFQINIKFFQGMQLTYGDPFMHEFMQSVDLSRIPPLSRICKESIYIFAIQNLCKPDNIPTRNLREMLIGFDTRSKFFGSCTSSRNFRNMIYHTIFGRQTQPYLLYLPGTVQVVAFISHLVTFCDPSTHKIALCQDLTKCPIGVDRILVSLRPDLKMIIKGILLAWPEERNQQWKWIGSVFKMKAHNQWLFGWRIW